MADEAASAPPTPARFTALELVAAEQLIHLSGSSCSSASASAAALSATPPPLLPVASASSSASPRSVNNSPPPPALAAAEDDEEDEQEVGGRRRRNKRYRPIAEIYAATEPKPIGGRSRKPADRTRKGGVPAAANKELAEARK
ncbi:hypothetical protein HU200_011739 [Digitaria exilis]|uniref:Uncharacterized protein n=1 Tax=Digitaria exilis TaxID=1010633 RepID=A0A835FEH9_9POAL|nr:hypothetical protein HU200_012525 [Digitaria exilis]KAF8753085.1 hypothetical protein HU200_011739 [Digitaria exilis]